MYLKSLELNGFKSFGKKSALEFSTPITAIVGPNGSGKSNCAESFRFVLGEQSMKSLRGKRGEDLIWGGSSEVPRANRASVKAVFDNTKRLLNVDFDEVVIERVVYRDGTNEYLVNNSKVRLKDITELLAGANVGSSGHHIISQGEADRVLAATPKERRQMIEDALGLRVYQYKKEESQKKLAKTEENKAQVEALRRENAPHLKFLEKQVKKLERARELRSELVTRYHEYLKREETYLALERETLKGDRAEPERALRDVEERIRSGRALLERLDKPGEHTNDILELEKELSAARRAHAEHVRSLGRIEGQIVFEERKLEEAELRARSEEGQPIPYKEARTFWDDLTRILDHAHSNGESPEAYRRAVHDAQALLRRFVERHLVTRDAYEPDTRELDRLNVIKTQTESEIQQVLEHITKLEERAQFLKREVDESKDKNRDLEREIFTLMARQSELRAVISRLDGRSETLRREEDEFKHEIAEGIALIGRQIVGYKDFVPSGEVLNLDTGRGEERSVQLDRRRELEKLKIRLEEIGGSSADEVVKEYEEIKARDQFLEHELADLEHSAASLRKLIDELDRDLKEKYRAGVEAVSAEFNTFFALMFGGGSARLTVVAEKKPKGLLQSLLTGQAEEESDEEDETAGGGIDVEVSLPKKRIQNLMMLSGGERALTSIALIFAISQVNPPPFIILDETDAALDEANSKRYGDMIESLSGKSQLILITHNRETMSRAGVLYGITMGIDGVSRILSVKFEEAAAVAK